MVNQISIGACVALLIALCAPASAASAEPDVAQMRQWIEQMREAPRGPFRRLRWFCADGSVLPPEPNACSDHGGGRQHGQWSRETRRIREAGYPIATVFAALEPDRFVAAAHGREQLARVLIEQFLIEADDGWILHRARQYRGGLQAEDEAASAARLLAAMAVESTWIGDAYLLLREAARLLPLDDDSPSVQQIRAEASSIAREDPGFEALRNKIHARPDGSDARRVRSYARSIDDGELRGRLEALARRIAHVHDPASVVAAVTPRLRSAAGLEAMAVTAKALDEVGAAERLRLTAELLRELRQMMPELGDADDRVAALRVSVALEQLAFSAAAELVVETPRATRAERLVWLQSSLDALYGTGWITTRERRHQERALATLATERVALARYRETLDYLARVPGWGRRRLQFHFAPAAEHMAVLEPLARGFVTDRIRGSLLLFHAELLASLQADAATIAGVSHRLFGQGVTHGVRSLNAGFATGVLRTEDDLDTTAPPEGIYVLAETTADLPPVDGIITTDEGNPVSHVQLLASDLGIPNAVVAEDHLAAIRAHRGHEVVLAVSPRGVVHMATLSAFADEPGTPRGGDRAARSQARDIEVTVAAAVADDRKPITLEQLSARDAGRRVGPKAAELAELHRRFPQHVSPGIALPFGVFLAVMERPIEPGGPSAAEWLRGQREALRGLEGDARDRQSASVLARLRDWLREQRLVGAMREQLRRTMREQFGEDGHYGVFVRSDTNVEDLPGFTGAGLNRTRAHVVGFESILAAIAEVWASAFTDRAQAWRRGVIAEDTPVLPSVLLHKSVPADKSGVLIASGVTSDHPQLEIAVNEGVGGVVDGQKAEHLRVDAASGRLHLLASATATHRQVLAPRGGLRRQRASGAARVLEPAEIERLIALVQMLPARYPQFLRRAGPDAAIDIEFGFVDGELTLFQLRPYVRDTRGDTHPYLRSLDAQLEAGGERTVALGTVPEPLRGD